MKNLQNNEQLCKQVLKKQWKTTNINFVTRKRIYKKKKKKKGHKTKDEYLLSLEEKSVQANFISEATKILSFKNEHIKPK